MCDFKEESRRAINEIGADLNTVLAAVGPKACAVLLRHVRDGRARAGNDLHDGKPLPHGSLAKGHYMSDENFERAIVRMEAEPSVCAWCREPLPQELVAEHRRPHNRREIKHHFHTNCWRARLVAIGAIFGFGHIEATYAVRWLAKARRSSPPARGTLWMPAGYRRGRR